MLKTNADAADWADLDREFDAWGGSGLVATLWWRDDDAVRMTRALGRLLDLAAGTPISLAVIPGRVVEADAPELRRVLEAVANLSVLQHGWMHINHAPPGAKKSELGEDRPVALIMTELAAGRRRLAALFGSLALPVLTPPWNRLAAALPPRLREAGYVGLSTAGARLRAEASPGLVQANTHADLIAWPGRGFIGAPTALGRLVAHLRARRSGAADAAEPTGLLTHHLVQDEATTGFIAQLLAFTRKHPAARWIGAAEVFGTS
jgi:hypothetical protein